MPPTNLMNRDRSKRLLPALALACALTAAAAAARPAPAPEASCEGDACASVTLTFDEAKQQYHARNDSPDRWVTLSVANRVAAAGVCLAPGRDAFLPIKGLVPPYRASFAEARCGAPDGVG